MPAKEITHTMPGLTAVLREKLGSDVLDTPTIQMIVIDDIAKRLKLKDGNKVPNRYWARVVFVVNLIQQVVSLSGDDRFDIPTIDDPAEDIIDFYDFVMVLPEKTIEFFQSGLRRFDVAPNHDGGNSDPASKNELTETLETKTPIPA